MGKYIFSYRELKRCGVSKVEELPHIIEILHPDGSALYIKKGKTFVLVTPEFKQLEINVKVDLTLLYEELEKRCPETKIPTNAEK